MINPKSFLKQLTIAFIIAPLILVITAQKMNIARSQEREQFLTFAPSYVTMIQMLYTRKDFPQVSSIKDLFGKRFAVPKGFYLHGVLKDYP
ncbi:MAG: hypothetical protein HQ517_07425 [SAR324 cluster bacterium]|nr:hypothetical protein [SAR324 cluster bacterium]